jgi:hypothetical protein
MDLTPNARLDLIRGIAEFVQGTQAAQMGPGDEAEVSVQMIALYKEVKTFKVEVTYAPGLEPRVQYIITEK